MAMSPEILKLLAATNPLLNAGLDTPNLLAEIGEDSPLPITQQIKRDPRIDRIARSTLLSPDIKRSLVARENQRVAIARKEEEIKRAKETEFTEEKISLFDADKGLFATIGGVPTPFMQVGTYLGIENPILRFAIDVIVDPLNLATGGLGMLTKLGRGMRRLVQAGNAISPAAKAKIVLDGLRTVATQVVEGRGKLMPPEIELFRNVIVRSTGQAKVAKGARVRGGAFPSRPSGSKLVPGDLDEIVGQGAREAAEAGPQGYMLKEQLSERLDLFSNRKLDEEDMRDFLDTMTDLAKNDKVEGPQVLKLIKDIKARYAAGDPKLLRTVEDMEASARHFIRTGNKDAARELLQGFRKVGKKKFTDTELAQLKAAGADDDFIKLVKGDKRTIKDLRYAFTKVGLLEETEMASGFIQALVKGERSLISFGLPFTDAALDVGLGAAVETGASFLKDPAAAVGRKWKGFGEAVTGEREAMKEVGGLLKSSREVLRAGAGGPLAKEAVEAAEEKLIIDTYEKAVADFGDTLSGKAIERRQGKTPQAGEIAGASAGKMDPGFARPQQLADGTALASKAPHPENPALDAKDIVNFFLEDRDAVLKLSDMISSTMHTAARGDRKLLQEMNRLLHMSPEKMHSTHRWASMRPAQQRILNETNTLLTNVGDEMYKRGLMEEFRENYFTLLIHKTPNPTGDQLGSLARRLLQQDLSKTTRNTVEEVLDALHPSDKAFGVPDRVALLDAQTILEKAMLKHWAMRPAASTTGQGGRFAFTRMLEDSDAMIAHLKTVEGAGSFKIKSLDANVILDTYLRASGGAVIRDRFLGALSNMRVTDDALAEVGMNFAAVDLRRRVPDILAMMKAHGYKADEVKNFVEFLGISGGKVPRPDPKMAAARARATPEQRVKYDKDIREEQMKWVRGASEASGALSDHAATFGKYGMSPLQKSTLEGWVFHKEIKPHITAIFEESSWFAQRKMGGSGLEVVTKGLHYANSLGKASLFNLNPFFHAMALTMSNFALLPVGAAVGNTIDVWNLLRATTLKTDADKASDILMRIMSRTRGIDGSQQMDEIFRSPIQLGRVHQDAEEAFGIVDRGFDAIIKRLPESEKLLSPQGLVRKGKHLNMLSDQGLWNVLQNVYKVNSLMYIRNAQLKKLAKRGAPMTAALSQDITNEAAMIVNQAFGGLAWERLMIQPKTRTVMRWALLAPDWTMSNLLMARDLFVNMPGVREKGLGKMMTRDVMFNDMRFHWALSYNVRALTYGFLASNLANYLFTGIDPDEPLNPSKFSHKRAYFLNVPWMRQAGEAHIDIKTGMGTRIQMPWTMPQYDPKTGEITGERKQYMDLYRQFTEPLALVTDPTHLITSKMGVLPRLARTGLLGLDSFGNPVAGVKDGPYADIMKRIGSAGGQFLPIPAQQADRLISGDMNPYAFGLSVVGFPVSLERFKLYQRRQKVGRLEGELAGMRRGPP